MYMRATYAEEALHVVQVPIPPTQGAHGAQEPGKVTQRQSRRKVVIVVDDDLHQTANNGAVGLRGHQVCWCRHKRLQSHLKRARPDWHLEKVVGEPA